MKPRLRVITGGGRSPAPSRRRRPRLVVLRSGPLAAETHHVLVVLPTDEREGRMQRAIWLERPRYQRQDCCTFWTTNVHRLRRWGAADAIWLGVNLGANKPLRAEEATLRLRTPLNRFRAIRRSPGTIEDRIGKPSWWVRRPGGGEAA
ncbi:MAG TPA: hypothetical protein VNG93_13895 [Candidatus Dormibacteraeota bacterium]|nr:hypothetical protein [Candidatus Dormibacteraeota bacterium]